MRWALVLLLLGAAGCKAPKPWPGWTAAQCDRARAGLALLAQSGRMDWAEGFERHGRAGKVRVGNYRRPYYDPGLDGWYSPESDTIGLDAEMLWDPTYGPRGIAYVEIDEWLHRITPGADGSREHELYDAAVAAFGAWCETQGIAFGDGRSAQSRGGMLLRRPSAAEEAAFEGANDG